MVILCNLGTSTSGWGTANPANPNNTGTQNWNNSNRSQNSNQGQSQDGKNLIGYIFIYFTFLLAKIKKKNVNRWSIFYSNLLFFKGLYYTFVFLQRTKRIRTDHLLANSRLPHSQVLVGASLVLNHRQGLHRQLPHRQQIPKVARGSRELLQLLQNNNSSN